MKPPFTNEPDVIIREDVVLDIVEAMGRAMEESSADATVNELLSAHLTTLGHVLQTLAKMGAPADVLERSVQKLLPMCRSLESPAGGRVM